MDGPLLGMMGLTLVILIVFYMDFKARIARIEHKLNTLLHHDGVDILEGRSLSENVKTLARDPKLKIQAIKAYRDETGAGLAEAKTAVEAFINSL